MSNDNETPIVMGFSSRRQKERGLFVGLHFPVHGYVPMAHYKQLYVEDGVKK